jgi:hypothetical protein
MGLFEHSLKYIQGGRSILDPESQARRFPHRPAGPCAAVPLGIDKRNQRLSRLRVKAYRHRSRFTLDGPQMRRQRVEPRRTGWPLLDLAADHIQHVLVRHRSHLSTPLSP